MKKILSILLCSIVYIVNIFGYTEITYVNERTHKVRTAIHYEVAQPAYIKNTKYSDLITKAQEYEKAGKWIYAYGTYSDAALISDGDRNAREQAEDILSLISNGNPGRGSFDAFSLHDKWIELITESERYFAEFPPFELQIQKPIQKDLHYDTRTADYEIKINIYCSDRCKKLKEALFEGYHKVRKDDWNIPLPWWNDSGESVVPDRIRYGDLKSIEKPAEKMKSSIEAAKKKGIPLSSCIDYDRYECFQRPSFRAELGDYTFYEIEIGLYDKTGIPITKSERILLQEIRESDGQLYEYKGQAYINVVLYSKWLAKNLNQDIMSKIEAGEVYAKITNMYLHYGYLSLPLGRDANVINIIKDLPEIKIDISNAIIYYEDEISSKISAYKEKEAERARLEKIEKDKIAAEQAAKKAEKEAEKRAKLEEEQKKRYLIESGKIPSNISYSDVAVNIDQKNGTIVTQIKQITNGSAFEKSGIQKGDLITDVYVNNTSRYREFIEAVYAKETSSFDILLANTTKEVTFIIQRGKGKKAQTITITIPVEFNFDGYIN